MTQPESSPPPETAPPTQLLRLLSQQGMPNPSVDVGVWDVKAHPSVDPYLFKITVPVDQTDLADPTNAVIMAKVHKIVDIELNKRYPDAQLAARIQPYVGVDIPHTFTPPA